MKVPLEILIVTILVYLGWGQSFEEQVSRISGRPAPERTVRIQKQKAGLAGPRAATPVDTSWMRRHGKLDRPIQQ